MQAVPNILPELWMGLASLMAHKLRSLLTMLGMIFGVGAVVAMLSITAGAQQETLRQIDLLGVNNIIVEAKEAVEREGAPGHAPDLSRLDLPRLSRAAGEYSLMSRRCHPARVSSRAACCRVQIRNCRH